MNLAALTGPKAFGGAYRIMLEYDAHAPGSVDRELVGSMVRLCDETASHLYRSYTNLSVGYEPGSRPELERFLAEAESSEGGPVDRVAAIAGLTLGLAEKRPAGRLPEMRFGGTEEQIIARGSDWCADVARVGCALYQVSGFPCRMVYLFNLDAAYSGHVIVEVHRSGKWGAVDTSSGVIYQEEDGVPASTLELMNDAHLVKRHAGPDAWYTNPEQFTAAGIANYNVCDFELYDYEVTGLNDYTRAVLSMADRGWPGGLRWLHGEANEAG
ncbi:MAG: hypothetical protein OXH50_20010 [Gemmatimonadetes bacterium]|nr:hypothetical protein [Gemmatimonadota bacterium]